MLEQVLRLCEEKSLQKPSCYQGDYNLVTRGMETKLLPILRAHSMTFNAFRWVTLRLIVKFRNVLERHGKERSQS